MKSRFSIFPLRLFFPDVLIAKRAATAVTIIYRDVGSHPHFPPISLLQHAQRRAHSKDVTGIHGNFCCTPTPRQAVFQA